MRTNTVASLAILAALTPGMLLAQSAPPPKTAGRSTTSTRARAFSRVFVDVDGSYQSHTFSFSDTRTDPRFVEKATWTADYSVKSGPSFGVSGGVRLWRQLIARVGFSSFTDTNAAAIVGTVPHPFFFNRDRSFSGSQSGLKQQENVVDVGAAWVAPVGARLDVRVFGGPSFYQITRDLIQNVNYRDSYPYDTAEFSGIERAQVSESATGFHVGADVTCLISRLVGVGGAVRFGRASFTLTSPASGSSLSLEAGGLQVGGGLRLRFGGAGSRRTGPDRRGR